jgi:hypothetical protein
MAKNVLYINPRHYDLCYYKKYIIQAYMGPYRPIQAHTGPYRHFKNMKIASYNRNGQKYVG